MEKKMAKRMTVDDFRNYVKDVMFYQICAKTHIPLENVLNYMKEYEYSLEEMVIYGWTDLDKSPKMANDNDLRLRGYELFSEIFTMANEDLKKVEIGFMHLQMGRDFFTDKDVMFVENNGVVVIPCFAHDEEHIIDVAFVLYVDTNYNLRAYIPKEGNTYCEKYMCAYGMEAYNKAIADGLSVEEAETYLGGIDSHYNEQEECQKFYNDVFSHIIAE